MFRSFYESTLTLFQGQYPLFGNAAVLPTKVIWDYTYYWGVLCQLVFQQRLADIGLLGEMRAVLERARDLNLRMQQLFRAWHAAAPGHGAAGMLDQGTLPWFIELNRGLHDVLDDAQVRTRLRRNVDLLGDLAAAIAARAGVRLDAGPATDRPAGARPLLFAAA